MTDITERLRRYNGPWLVPAEAADEIEKLRGEVAALKAAAEKGTEYVLAQINQDLRAEIAAKNAPEIEKANAYIRKLEAERDAAVARYEYLRRLNVQQFQKLYLNCLNGARFDDQVDAGIDALEEVWGRSIK